MVLCGGGVPSRQYGLSLDQLIDVKIVLANGEKVHANEYSNEDLFWAIRGAGGGNFGVITDFKFRSVKVE